MFGRRDRKKPLVRDTDERLEDLRDDCIALFVNSGLTQKQLHERGGPTPQTTAKWLYKETKFPRFQTITALVSALGKEVAIVDPQDQAVTGSRISRLRLQRRANMTMPIRARKARKAARP